MYKAANLSTVIEVKHGTHDPPIDSQHDCVLLQQWAAIMGVFNFIWQEVAVENLRNTPIYFWYRESRTELAGNPKY